jgi:3'(2'), 5'-bisphosphate nucleotidase
MPIQLENLLPQVTAIARAAGEIISEFYRHKNYQVHLKSDNSPVTDADLAAHHFICRELDRLAIAPIISEESEQPLAVERESSYWLVDPLDGTREFLEATGEFTVNIALIRRGEPVLGVISAPIFRTSYFAARKLGSFRQREGEAVERLHCRSLLLDNFSLLASRRFSPEIYALYRDTWPGCTIITLGSSLKFCRIAEGSADLYIRRGHTGEWDTAAAQCVIEEAGGIVVDLHGERLLYGKPNFLNQHFIACGDPEYKNLISQALLTN